MRKINFSSPFMIFLIFLIIFQPDYVNYISGLGTLWEYLRYGVFLLILLTYLKKKKISKLFLIYLIFFTIMLLSTYLNNGKLSWYISQYVPYLAILMYCEILYENSLEKFFNAIFKLIIVLLTINLASIFMFPNGITSPDTYFLGLDNTYTPMIVFGLAITLIYCELYNKSKFLKMFLILLAVLTFFVTNCSTGIIGILVFVTGYIFKDKIKNSKIFKYKNYIFISLILTYAIVVLRLQEHLAFIIVNLLEKNLTFTNRIYIWDEALYLIKNNPILGIGYSLGHSHCNYLNIAKTGGILAILCYIVLLFLPNKKIKKYKSNTIITILSFAMLSYFIMTIDEYYFYNYLFIIVISLLYNCDKIIKLQGEINERKIKKEEPKAI